MKCLDELIYKALRNNKKVSLFLCRDIEGGFGIKINGKVVQRNLAWECFEIELEEGERK